MSENELMNDKLTNFCENLMLYIGSLSTKSSFQEIVSVSLLWLKTHFKNSAWSNARRYLAWLGEQDAADVMSSGLRSEGWDTTMAKLRSSWSQFRSSPLAKRFFLVVNYVVTLGLCEASQVTFRYKQFELFAPQIIDKQLTCVDCVEACLELVTCFVESIYACFRENSVVPLLFGTSELNTIDEEYVNICKDFDLFRNGNLQEADGGATSHHDFEHKLNCVIDKVKRLMSQLTGFARRSMEVKLNSLLKIQTDMYSLAVATGQRHAPWAFEVYGRSNQGKTAFADQLVTLLLASQNMDISSDRRCTVNMDDKYMSTWTSDMLVMVMDDLANTNPNFVSEAPTRRVIDYINNAPCYATKADISEKGKSLIQPWIVVATTNKKDLAASSYSCHPISIQRRFICMTVELKPQYALCRNGAIIGVDPAKVQRDFPPGSLVTDIWNVTVEVALPPETDDCVTAHYGIVHWERKDGEVVELRDVGIEVVAQWSIEQFSQHVTHQLNYLESFKNRPKTLERCSQTCNHIRGKCPYHAPDVQSGLHSISILPTTLNSVDKALSVFRVVTSSFVPRVDTLLSNFLLSLVNYRTVSFFTLHFLPYSWARSRLGRKLFEPLIRNIIGWQYYHIVPCVLVLWFCYACYTLYLCLDFSILWIMSCTVVFLFLLYVYMLYNYMCYEYVLHRVRSNQISCYSIVSHYRASLSTECGRIIFGTISALSALYAARKLWAIVRKPEPQGDIVSNTPEAMLQRDMECNVYARVVRRPLPLSEKSKTTDCDRLWNTVRKNLLHAYCGNGDEVCQANILMLTTGVGVIPSHYLSSDVLSVECTRYGKEGIGSRFRTIIDVRKVTIVEGTDLAIVPIVGGGSFPDLTDYLPRGYCRSSPFRWYSIMQDGEFRVAKGRTNPRHFTTKVSVGLRGGNYSSFSSQCNYGDCGAVLLSDSKGSTILGFHVAGVGGTPTGYYCDLQYDEAMEAINKLRTSFALFEHAKDSTLPDAHMGVKYLLDEDTPQKSPINYMPDDSSIVYYGRCVGGSTFKSRVCKTAISDSVARVCGYPNIYRPPIENPQWKPWQSCLESMSTPGESFAQSLVERCKLDYLAPLEWIVRKHPSFVHGVLTNEENLCGVAGKRFLDALQVNTSMGYPFKGTKKQFLVVDELDEHSCLHRELHPEVMQWIAVNEEQLARGERCYFIAKACRKDEVVSKEKGRIFFAANVGMIFLVRKYFLGLSRYLQSVPLLSECAVGINAQGPEWHQMHSHATYFGEETIIAGDYKSYDQKLPVQLIEASLAILIQLAKASGKYSERDLRVMKSLATEICYPLIAFNGDLISCSEGTHVSGNPLTVIINSIAGSLNMRAVFFSLYPADKYFRDKVKLITYGDDNIGSVAPDRCDYNIESIAQFLGERGQVFTMPDKTLTFRPYISVEEFEFLKRKSVSIEGTSCMVGALDEKSIFKRLHCVLVEKGSGISMRERCAENVDSALEEWFFHGRKVFELRRQQMIEVTRECDLYHLCSNLNKSYDCLLQKWYGNYGEQLESLLPMHKNNGDSAGLSARVRECEAMTWERIGYQCDHAHDHTRLSFPDDVQNVFSDLSRYAKRQNKKSLANRMNRLLQYKNTPRDISYQGGLSDLADGNIDSENINNKRCIVDDEFSMAISKISLNDERLPDVQMATVGENHVDTGQSMSNAHISFNDGTRSQVKDLTGLGDETRQTQMEQMISLESFLSRPVIIKSYNIATNVNFGDNFDPWSLYFEHPTIREKLRNFKLLTADLKLKFVINGNMADWGCFMALYLPLQHYQQSSTPSTLITGDLTEASKYPHVMLQPRDSTGAEMVLPFMWHYDALSIPSNDWRKLGEVIMYTIEPLKHASPTTSNVSITVYAEACNVRISGMTSQVAADPQMGEIDEANAKGIISGPATSVARVANMANKALSTMGLPGLQPYARATEMSAKAVAGAAKLLGYSRPPVTRTGDPYIPTMAASLANTTVPDSVAKLAVDDKQELTIDPRIAGGPDGDVLKISTWAGRPSILGTFDWSSNDAVGDLLVNFRVQPSLFNQSGVEPKYHLTSLCEAALPFEFWTGTINFHFKVIRSKFHVGRLVAKYDPVVDTSSDVSTGITTIMDLSGDQDEFCIPIRNNQARTWLRSYMPGPNSATETWSNTAYTEPGLGNGVLTIRVANRLSLLQDSANNSIRIIVSVNAGDDFRVAVPDDRFALLEPDPQMGNILCLPLWMSDRRHTIVSSEHVSTPSSSDMEYSFNEDLPWDEFPDPQIGHIDEPLDQVCSSVNNAPSQNENVDSVYIGEAFESFRPLIKRYNAHRRDLIAATTTGELIATRCSFPLYKGAVRGAVDSGGVNQVNLTLLNYLALAHAGWRGSVRYKFIITDFREQISSSLLQIERLNQGKGVFENNRRPRQTYTVESAAAELVKSTSFQPYALGYNGSAITSTMVNPMLSVELPFYSDARFVPGRMLDASTASSPSIVDFVGGYQLTTSGGTFQNTSCLNTYVAAGEDFQYFFYTGLPAMVYRAIP